MNLITFIEHIYDYSESLLTLLGFVFAINLVNWLILGSVFNIFGIVPRSIQGVIGIVLAPILHGNVTHFILNAIPFYCLSLLMIALIGLHFYVLTVLAISLISGVFIWAFARPGVHIGGSAMITGLFSWLVYHAFINPTPLSLLILTIVLFYFGSMIAGVLPSDPIISWEGHLFGLIAGMIVASKHAQVLEQALLLEYEFYHLMGIGGVDELLKIIGSYTEPIKQWFEPIYR